jgi:D-alanyl-D-alanine dipeptidase
MWEVVKGTQKQGYVANPNTKVGSIHNYGCAVDLTLSTADGKALPMGTPFDHFGPEAGISNEPKLLEDGKITAAELANRLLLREVMVAAGFIPLAHEWWHFNCMTSAETRKKYRMIE